MGNPPQNYLFRKSMGGAAETKQTKSRWEKKKGNLTLEAKHHLGKTKAIGDSSGGDGRTV